MSTFITPDGGLTGAGYALFIIIAVIALLAAWYLAGKFSAKRKLSPKQIAFCGLALALAYVTSFIQIFKLPFGGSVTLFSMLFIVLVANWYGAATGILVGLVYGILQFRVGSLKRRPAYRIFFQMLHRVLDIRFDNLTH